MSEDLTRLMDRVAADSPPMDVSLDSVIGEAKGRRRRQRTVGAGMGFAALALAGTLWWGLGGQGLLGGGLERSPAGRPEGVLTDGLSTDGVLTDGGSRIAGMTGDTVTAGGRTFRIEERDGGIELVEDGIPVARLDSGALRLGPSITDDSGPGAVAAMVPPGQDPGQVRYGRPTEVGAPTWELPDSVVRLDLADGRSVLVVGVPEVQDLVLADGDGRTDPLQLLGAEAGGGVTPVPVAVYGLGRLDVFGSTEGFVAMEDGNQLGAQVLPDGRSVTFAGSDGSTALVLVDAEGLVSSGGHAEVVVRDLGRVRLGLEGVLRGLHLLDLPGGTVVVGVTAPGSEVLGGLVLPQTLEGAGDGGGTEGGAGTEDGAGGQAAVAGPQWLGGGATRTVETELAPITLAADLGTWALQPPDGQPLAVVGGLGEALVPVPRTTGPGGEMLDGEDPHTFELVAVVPTADLGDAGPNLVTEGGLTLVGEEQVGVVDVPGGDVTAYVATVTVPEGSSLAYAVRGLDVDGDGGVDLPLVTDNRHWDLGPDGRVVTLLGEPYLVAEGEDGWPVLEHLDDPAHQLVVAGPEGEAQELSVAPVRWSWEGDGLVLAVPGWRADPLEMVGFTSTDPADWTVDEPQGMLWPRDLVVVEGAAGPVTLVGLSPAQAAVAGELRVVDEQGVERSVRELAVDPADQSAGAEGQIDTGHGIPGEVDGELSAPLEGMSVDADLVPSVGGVQLAEVGPVPGGGGVLWALPGSGSDPARGLLVVPGRTAADVVLPMTGKGESRDLGGGLVLAERTVESPAGPVLVQVLPEHVLSGTEVVGLVALDAERMSAGSGTPWTILGSSDLVDLALADGMQMTAALDQDLWVFAPTDDDVLANRGHAGLVAQVGLIGQAVFEHAADEEALHAVFLADRHQAARIVHDAEAEILSAEVLEVPDTELVLHHTVLRVPAGTGAFHVSGYDLDGNGETDLSFPQRG